MGISAGPAPSTTSNEAPQPLLVPAAPDGWGPGQASFDAVRAWSRPISGSDHWSPMGWWRVGTSLWGMRHADTIMGTGLSRDVAEGFLRDHTELLNSLPVPPGTELVLDSCRASLEAYRWERLGYPAPVGA